MGFFCCLVCFVTKSINSIKNMWNNFHTKSILFFYFDMIFNENVSTIHWTNVLFFQLKLVRLYFVIVIVRVHCNFSLISCKYISIKNRYVEHLQHEMIFHKNKEEKFSLKLSGTFLCFVLDIRHWKFRWKRIEHVVLILAKE